MKKFALVLFICSVFFILTSCNDPHDVEYPYQELRNNVIGVELIRYESNKTSPFDFDKMEIIAELEADMLDDFLTDYYDLTMMNRPNSDSYVGESIRIIYDNGDFELISCNNEEHKINSFLARFNSDGKLLELIGSIEKMSEFEYLIDHYFYVQS